MISYKYAKLFCKDDISLIENYEEAINSDEIWDCHHRLEIELNLSRKELKDRNLYYNRPASELIFLTHADHRRLHNTGRKFNPYDSMTCEALEERRRKASNAMKGKHRVYHEDGTWHMEK